MRSGCPTPTEWTPTDDTAEATYTGTPTPRGDRHGSLRGFSNVCRHRGTRLLDEGSCRVGRFIRCPYHSWSYDLEGRCLGAPLFDRSGIPDDQRAIFDTSAAPSFDRADHGLLPVAVDSFGPVVLACLDPAAGPLAEPFGDLPERLAGYRLVEWRLARTGDYTGRCTSPIAADADAGGWESGLVVDRMVGLRRVPAGDAAPRTSMFTG